MEERFMVKQVKSGIALILLFAFCMLISLCISFLLFGNRVQKLVDKQELLTDPAINIDTLSSGEKLFLLIPQGVIEEVFNNSSSVMLNIPGYKTIPLAYDGRIAVYELPKEIFKDGSKSRIDASLNKAGKSLELSIHRPMKNLQ